MGARLSLRLRFFLFVAVLVAGVAALLVACGDDGSGGGTGNDGGSPESSTKDGPSGDDGPSPMDSGGGDADAGADADADAHPPLTGTYLWAERFGNDANGIVSGQVVVDPSGNIVVAGGFVKSVDFGGGLLTSAGGYDVFVAKFDSTGKHLWSKRFGDPGLQNAGQPAIDASGNIFVVGGFEGTVNFGGSDLTSAGGEDAFVVKFDANGNHLWSKRFGGTGTEVCSGVAVSGSNIVLLGTFTSTIDFGGGGLTPAPSQFLATLTGAAGDHVWSKVPANVTGAVTLYQEHVRVDGMGSIVVAGGFSGTIDFGGGALTTPGAAGAAEDIFVTKFSSAGVHTWSKMFGTTSQQIAKDFSFDSSGNVFITGEIGASPIDFGSGSIANTPNGVFVTKLEPAGSGAWAKAFGGEVATGLAVDAFGDVVIAGVYKGQPDFGAGALPLHDGSNGSRATYLAKFDGAGTLGWSKGWTGPGYNGTGGCHAAFDAPGNLAVTVSFAGTTDVGGGSVSSVSSVADMLLAKFAP